MVIITEEQRLENDKRRREKAKVDRAKGIPPIKRDQTNLKKRDQTNQKKIDQTNPNKRDQTNKKNRSKRKDRVRFYLRQCSY